MYNKFNGAEDGRIFKGTLFLHKKILKKFADPCGDHKIHGSRQKSTNPRQILLIQ